MCPLLDDKVCIVSGVGPGLGRSIAHAFAREGARLAVACRREEVAREIASEIEALGTRAVAIAADIAKPEDRERLVRTTIDAFGGVDVLVNNAFSTGRPGAIEGADIAKTWRSPFEVNVFGTLQLSQAVLPTMKERGGGSIVMINTLAARKRQPGLASYGAAKAALLAASESLAAEVGRYAIRVNSVVPSHIDGPNLRVYFAQEAARHGVSEDEIYRRVAAEGVLRHIPTSDEVAQAALFFASRMSSAITGQSLDVNAGQWFH